MLSYAVTKDQPRVFRSLTSLDVDEFEQLLECFRQAWEQYVQQHFMQRPRQRRYGGGRKPRLARIEEKLLFVLVYLKCYPIQEVFGFLFGLSQSQANVWIHRLTEVLRLALELSGHRPERDPEQLAEVLSHYETLDFLLDSTERRRQRPQDSEQQRHFYSGKKKAHTVKNNLIVHADTTKVAYLGQTAEGKRHDKKLADDEEYVFPANSVLGQDTGYQGFVPDQVILLQPKKKPKGKPLPGQHRILNKVIASFRIVVEHAIAGVKRCRVLKDTFRNTKQAFDDVVMEVACGLRNFRCQVRYTSHNTDICDYCR